jgi:hypothetical protein
MSTHPRDTDAEDREGTDDSYAALQVADDAMVIYDRENHRSWVQSDLAVGLDGMC